MDGHYLILLEHVNDVIKEFDGFENIRHISPLRDLVLALLGYQKEPFRMYISSIPKFGCCEILNAHVNIHHKRAVSLLQIRDDFFGISSCSCELEQSRQT